MKKSTFSAALLLSAGFLFSCNNANEGTTTTGDTATTGTGTGANTTGTTATTNQLNESDRTFVMDAAAGGMMEVEAGRLAQQNASNPQVKAFGEKMVQDHTNANNELMSIASAKNVTVPDSLPAKHREHLEAMRKMTGKAFDRHYMDMMVNDHKETVNKFQVNANNAQDPELKAFAAKTLPVLRAHMDSAQAIHGRIK